MNWVLIRVLQQLCVLFHEKLPIFVMTIAGKSQHSYSEAHKNDYNTILGLMVKLSTVGWK